MLEREVSSENPIDLRLSDNFADNSTQITAIFSDGLFFTRYATAIAEQIAKVLAERYVQEHYAEIAAKLDQQAIANLAMAKAAKDIAEEQINAQPPQVRIVKDTVVVEKGLFTTRVTRR